MDGRKARRPTYICDVTKQSFRNSLMLIIVTAVVLTGVQGYYALQNYEINKQRFINQVRLILDNSIESYFANRAKSRIYVLTNSSDSSGTLPQRMSQVKLKNNFDSLLDRATSGDSFDAEFTHVWSHTSSDSSPIYIDSVLESESEPSITRFRLNNTADTAHVQELQFLTQKVMISISEELLDLGEVYEHVQAALDQQGLTLAFRLSQTVNGTETLVGTLEDGDRHLTADATSAYLDESHTIRIEFENATLLILRDSISELVISILLIGLVIGTLVHLYRTIYAQKQLAAIKDDLISNITHEFKTPIATISTALEGVMNFNENNDAEKTRRYLTLSNEQLSKLNDMVEKMLETATLDQGKLSLSLEEVEAVSWTRELMDRFQLVLKEKNIRFESDLSSVIYRFDRFHLENALSNLIDNALKYGGDQIVVRLHENSARLVWEVEDNGGGIPAGQRDKIFEKLYRIPTGNTHDVKGFGIGLYYARTIAELHDGMLTLKVSNEKTLFRLSI